MFYRGFKWVAAVWIFTAAASAGHAISLVYEQVPTVNGFTADGSTTTPDGAVSQTYDNFTLPAAANVTAVTWQGIYVDTLTAANNPAALDTSSFVIGFYADDGGQPGALLASSTVSIGDCAPTLLATISYGSPSLGTTVQVPSYSYSATLPTPFAAAANQTYWLSIVSNCTADQPRWQWTSGSNSTSDGSCVQDLASGRAVQSGDRVFTLESTDLPTATITTAVPKTTPGGSPGQIVVSLSTLQTEKVKVHYLVKGTALNGKDYLLLSGVAKVKPGHSGATVFVTTENAVGTDKLKVKLVLEAGNGYTVGSPEVAAVKIVGVTVAPAIVNPGGK